MPQVPSSVHENLVNPEPKESLDIIYSNLLLFQKGKLKPREAPCVCRVTQLASGRAGAGATSPDPVSHGCDSSPGSLPPFVMFFFFWTDPNLPANLKICSALPPGS